MELKATNFDAKTVASFGYEWTKFDQSDVSESELEQIFNAYFSIFPWDCIGEDSVGFDLGCGTGRWARFIAPRVTRLHCIDPSSPALDVAKRNLSASSNCVFHLADVASMPLEDNSMDFGYSLGVLDHVPDTAAGIRSCADKLKPGAPLLVYIYYAFDNRPLWYRALWRTSDIVRRLISRLPNGIRFAATTLIAGTVYFPLARGSLALERMGADVRNLPLSAYRRRTFYTMRTDAFDRFGSPLERRFTAEEIRKMMEDAILERITFSSSLPYWCAVGYKKCE